MVQGRGWRVVVVVVGSMVAACGDDGPHAIDGSTGSLADAAPAGPDAAPAGPDAAPAGPDAAAGDGGAADAGSADAGSIDASVLADASPVDAGPPSPSIDSVTTSEGSGEVRQGSTVEIVVLGAGLAEVDAVAVGELTAIVLGAAPGEVRAELVVPHGTAPGPREVTVSGPGGSAGLADALSTTEYVVAPGAQPGGRGTFESPLALCDPEVVTAEVGDTVSLLAGEHVCDALDSIAFRPGVTLAGAGIDATLVRGETDSFPGFVMDSFGVPVEAITTARGFTLVAPQPVQEGALVFSVGGPFAVEDVRIEGPGVHTRGSITGTVARLEVDCGGRGNGLSEDDPANVTVTDSRIAGCQAGVSAGLGTWSVTGSRFERCGVGISSFGSSARYGDITVAGCELYDNTTGMSVRYSGADVTDTLVRDVEVTPASMQTGILVGTGGDLELTDSEITGHDGTGISIFASVEGPAFVVSLTDVLIVGGRIGVDADGRDNPSSLTMRDSVVRDQTVASVQLSVEWLFVNLDLGNGGGPGGNQLSVVSGTALRDLRPEPFEFYRTIDATGITLNGRSYDGQLVEGPASMPPDYEILADGLIQF